MIGHWLLTLTPQEEDRVLTTAMHPGDYVRSVLGGPCLVGVAKGVRCSGAAISIPEHATLRTAWNGHTVEGRFDDMCARVGPEKAGALIRQRILANRARRTLSPSSRCGDRTAPHAEAGR